jgi:N-acetyl-anhydromuramyl-L-alanine amidase AmpD
MGLAGSSGSVKAQQTSLEEEFQAASEEYGVPVGILKAIGYVNTRWEMPPPQASDYEQGGRDSGSAESRGNYGIMSLYQNPSKDTLGKAAGLTGLSEEELKTNRAANIRGGAAALSEIQGTQKPEDLNGWYDTVSKYGATDGGNENVLYANQVYETLQQGATAEISTGEKITLEAQPEAEPRQLLTAQSSMDYGRSTWYGTNGYNYTAANRGAAKIDKIIVHVTQGSWSGAISWFKNSSAQASAHYTVRSSDGKIGQSVREKDIAWHAGNWNYNERSIGIEHEGYVSESRWFTDNMYRSSARLTAYLCKKYNIRINRTNIIGHNEVPGATHTDPGRYWNWTKYMSMVKKYASNSSYKQVVDNASNRFRASSAWDTNTWNSQKYGKNYRATKPRNVKDTARFKVRIPKRGKYRIYARWPASSGYNSRTRFKIYTAGGWKIRGVNQRKNGGRWVRLGTYTMRAGDRPWVRVLRRSSGKGYIIADAVMIRRV